MNVSGGEPYIYQSLGLVDEQLRQLCDCTTPIMRNEWSESDIQCQQYTVTCCKEVLEFFCKAAKGLSTTLETRFHDSEQTFLVFVKKQRLCLDLISERDRAEFYSKVPNFSEIERKQKQTSDNFGRNFRKP